jgi:hypothetical protein
MMESLIKRQELLVDGGVVNHADIVLIDGQKRQKFVFMYHVINPESGVEWVDCIEMVKGSDGPWRSFRPEKVRIMKGKK